MMFNDENPMDPGMNPAPEAPAEGEPMPETPAEGAPEGGESAM